MNVFKNILSLLFILLGLFSQVEAKVIIIENEEIESFSGQNFHKQTSEAEWLGLLYLQDRSFSQSQYKSFNFFTEGFHQSFSEEVCLKSIGAGLMSGFQFLEISLSHQRKQVDVNKLFTSHPDLVDSWKVLDDANVPAALKRDPVRLGQVDNYLKKNPGTEEAIKKGLDDVGDYKEEFMNGIKNATEDLSHLNGRSALPDEIADAVTRIKQHRTDVGQLKGGNYGYLEGSVNGSAVDNKMWRSGGANPKTEPQIFDAIEVEGSSGSWLRNTDSEYKMLNQLADDLGGVKGQSYPDVNGTLKIVSENPYCASCQGVIQQFNEMFPNINLILVDGVR